MKAAEAPVAAATVPLLMQAINDPNTSVAMVAEAVASDAGLAARVLALANSAAFGMSRQVTEINQAVALVGSNMVQTLAIAGACDLLDGASGLPHARTHAIQVACGARVLAGRVGLSRADAFADGLLHDRGEMLLWPRNPAAYAGAPASWTDAREQLRGERGMFGTDHALAAREQLARWQLPGVIVDAAGDHHRPDLHHRDLSTAVIAGEELVDPDVSWSPRFTLFGLEPEGLEALRSDVDEQVVEMTGLLVRP